jgi:hypothetical protein
MRTNFANFQKVRTGGYLLMECLVYIGVLFLLLGVGYVALDRCIDNSIVLRRNADDISSALHAGERWRGDVRAASGKILSQNINGEQVVLLTTARGTRAYRFSGETIFRSLDGGTWTRLLDNVQTSSMAADPRGSVTAWRWEIELRPRLKGSMKPGRVRPLFTFMAVPERSSAR